MWPLTAAMPKPLLRVAGVPFVELQLGQLAQVGIEEVFLAVGRHGLDAWESFVAARSGSPEVRLVVEDEPLDTAGPVRAALSDLDDRFMVLNGDVVIETDLSAYLAAVPAEAVAALALVEVADPSAYGVVVTDGSGRVVRFVEKPPAATAPARTVNAGLYVMTRGALAGYAPGRLSFEQTVFPDLTAAGSLHAVVVDGRWMDIGGPGLYLDCTSTLLAGESSLYRSEGTHFVGPGVKADGGIGGAWVWVDSGATLGEGAVVEEAVVLAGAVVGRGAVVRRAVVASGARIGEGAVVTGDSVVGEGAVVGDGCEIDREMRIGPGAVIPACAVTFRPPA